MRIAQIAPLMKSVPPVGYGGTERVIACLTDELVRRGHDVTLFASADSRTTARLVPIVPRALWRDERTNVDALTYDLITFGKLSRALGDFDIVHNHVENIGCLISRLSPLPVVTTPHGRLDRPDVVELFREFDDAPLVSISDAQRRPVPDANWIATVYHGISLSSYTYSPHCGGYLAFLGRISPDKGLDIAIKVALRTGWRLKIGARPPLPYKHDPQVRRDWEHYERDILPLVDGYRIKMIGEVDGREKDELLGGAAALLFPITWPEPFGLVMVEAMACGTPVIALRHGSVPEVVDQGVTGMVCDSEEDLVEAVGHLGEIDRAACRAEALRRFSPERMADDYERVYAQLVRERAAADRVTAVTDEQRVPVGADGTGKRRSAPRPDGQLKATGLNAPAT